MSKKIPRRIKVISSRGKMAANGEGASPGGLYFGDYRPRYQENFDIYEKAKEHIRGQKRKNDNPASENDSAFQE